MVMCLSDELPFVGMIDFLIVVTARKPAGL
jgi:hypothetical protein